MQECQKVCGIFTNRSALITCEEKQLVRFDCSAKRSTKLVPLERALGRRKIVPRVKQIVAHEFEKIAVKLVGTGLCHRVDRCFLSVLSTQPAGFHFEFL